MENNRRQDLKIGIFTLLGLLVLGYATFQVSQKNINSSGSYIVTMVLESAVGLNRKTPVEIAGVQVGHVADLSLFEGRKALVHLAIERSVQLTKDVQAQVRTKGFLGETYIDLIQGESKETLGDGSNIAAVNPYVDLTRLTNELYLIAQDVKQMTGEMKGHFVPGGNWDEIMDNFASLSARLDNSAGHLDSIAEKIDSGRGSIGRLVNDEETINNVNEAAQGFAQTVGAVNRFQTEFGYHLEYLGVSNDFKNYVGIKLKPRPDKYFQVDFVVDPNPAARQKLTTSNITTGGTTTTVVTDQSVVDKNRFLISAQLAKQFYDFTIRGGVIESSGGIGLDYGYGPVGLEFSAFDFRTDGAQRPHLKGLGYVNLTQNLYLMSGVDDFISNSQDPDWFFGAGFRLVDDDIKALFGAAKF